MKKSAFLLPSLIVGATTLLLAPAKESYGFSKLGSSLNVGSERDFRVHNIFADAAANNNQTPDANYPGWQGADMAMWKAAAEWGSRAHGTGAGDPTQPNIGDGGANFDFFFGGAATGPGNNRKVVSVLPNCGGGGVLAYVTNGGNAWNMRFCDEWSWGDGPGGIGGGQFDIQGVGAHELGHSLGLGHSNQFSATMFGSIGSGSESERSINADDMNGLQCVYGVADPAKPVITGVNVDVPGNTITITGQNFSLTGNGVWFTNSFPTAPNDDPRVIVTGVDSPTTTQITLSLPTNAGDGNVHVRSTIGGFKSLSNSWPVDLMGASGPSIEITSVSPSMVDSLIPAPDETVTISGNGFSSGTTVTIDGIALDPADYTFVDSTTITLEMPQATQLGPVEVRVDDGSLTDSSTITIVAPVDPVLQVGNGLDFNSNQIQSSNGIDVIYAGIPGEFNFVIGSTSNVPSSIPIVSLCLGNSFTDLFEVTSGVMAPEGYLELNIPLNPVFAVFYFQSLTFGQGTPIPASNCQEALIFP